MVCRVCAGIMMKQDDRYVVKCQHCDCAFAGQETSKKPPLGLMPIEHHNYQRKKGLVAAICRYVEDDKTIPSSWLIELSDLNAMLAEE